MSIENMPIYVPRLINSLQPFQNEWSIKTMVLRQRNAEPSKSRHFNVRKSVVVDDEVSRAKEFIFRICILFVYTNDNSLM